MLIIWIAPLNAIHSAHRALTYLRWWCHSISHHRPLSRFILTLRTRPWTRKILVGTRSLRGSAQTPQEYSHKMDTGPVPMLFVMKWESEKKPGPSKNFFRVYYESIKRELRFEKKRFSLFFQCMSLLSRPGCLCSCSLLCVFITNQKRLCHVFAWNLFVPGGRKCK